MSNLAGSVISALVAFVFTNLDDLILLTVFFGEAKANQTKVQKSVEQGTPPPSGNPFNRWHVIWGQVLGFSALVLISLIGFLVGVFVRKEYIGLLGFLPFIIGAYKLYEVIHEECGGGGGGESEGEKDSEIAGDSGNEDSPVAVVRFHYYSESILDDEISKVADANQKEPSMVDQSELKAVVSDQVDDQAERTCEQPSETTAKAVQSESAADAAPPQETMNESEEPNAETETVDNAMTVFFGKCAQYVLHPHTWRVLTVTIANGADNISIYVPLFASADAGQIVVILIVFYVLLLVWCAASYLLLMFPPISKAIEKYGEWLVPIALMAVGVYILYSADCIDLVT